MAQITSNITIPSRPLYYAKVRFGAAADLLALVRCVFVLSQQTYNLAEIDTAEQLDNVMRSQLVFWEEALLMASNVNYDILYTHFLTGGRK